MHHDHDPGHSENLETEAIRPEGQIWEQTAPLQAEPIQPLPQETLPVPPIAAVEKSKEKRVRKSSRLRLGAIIGLAALLVLTIFSVTYLAVTYEIELSGEQAGLSVTLYPRRGEGARIQSPDEDADASDSALEQDEPGGLVDDPDLPTVTLGSGATLALYPHPAADEETGLTPRLSFQEIYQQCSPSIVLIEVQLGGGLRSGTGSGTGIIMTENGYIVTSAHVIEGARRITVTLRDLSQHTAAIVGEDEITDIAVLKIDAVGLTPAVFGDSDLLQVGEEVAVIGNPLGQFHSMSNGIVSALNRDITYDGVTMRMIQTNAAINSGNSGGPLLNLYGQVVGITNMKFVGTGHNDFSVEGMGFAIPTAILAPVVNDILTYGRVAGRPSIGIIVNTVDVRTAEEEGIDPGVYVERVLENTDAARQGLLVGDQILYANDAPVLTALDLRAEIQRHRAGDAIVLTVLRDGTEYVLTILLMDTELLEF